MVTLAEVLEVNWIILYFVYGQVFFVVGLVTGLQWRRQSRVELARPLPWLAAFGVAHGLNEWGYIFIPLQALYLEDSVVRVMVIAHMLLLAVSFFFLFQFGVELLSSLRPQHCWLWILPGGVLLLWGLAVFLRGALIGDPLNVLFAIGDGWSRYLLAFPGSILAFLGMRRQSHQVRQMGLPRIAIYFTGAAMAFLMYALVGGLMVPTAPVFPANLLNYALLDRMIHLPAPVFRSLCGLAIAFFVTRSMEVFQAETDRRIAEMEQAQIVAVDRERIGRELHDGIIQNIYAAGLNLERVRRQRTKEPDRTRRIQAVLDILNQTTQDIRNYVFDLRAEGEARELEVVLEGLVRDLRLDTLLEARLVVMGQRCWQMSPQQTAHLTQIAREALSNVVQHAEAGHVTVDLRYAGKSVCLTVADDGKGVALDDLGDMLSPGRGIANIQERTRLMGGEFMLESELGHGLRLSVTTPCGDGRDPARG